MASGPSASELSDEQEMHQYRDEMPEDISAAQILLEKYSEVPPEQVKCHILKTVSISAHMHDFPLKGLPQLPICFSNET